MRNINTGDLAFQAERFQQRLPCTDSFYSTLPNKGLTSLCHNFNQLNFYEPKIPGVMAPATSGESSDLCEEKDILPREVVTKKASFRIMNRMLVDSKQIRKLETFQEVSDLWDKKTILIEGIVDEVDEFILFRFYKIHPNATKIKDIR